MYMCTFIHYPSLIYDALEESPKDINRIRHTLVLIQLQDIVFPFLCSFCLSSFRFCLFLFLFSPFVTKLAKLYNI